MDPKFIIKNVIERMIIEGYELKGITTDMVIDKMGATNITPLGYISVSNILKEVQGA